MKLAKPKTSLLTSTAAALIVATALAGGVASSALAADTSNTPTTTTTQKAEIKNAPTVLAIPGRPNVYCGEGNTRWQIPPATNGYYYVASDGDTGELSVVPREGYIFENGISGIYYGMPDASATCVPVSSKLDPVYVAPRPGETKLKNGNVIGTNTQPGGDIMKDTNPQPATKENTDTKPKIDPVETKPAEAPNTTKVTVGGEGRIQIVGTKSDPVYKFKADAPKWASLDEKTGVIIVKPGLDVKPGEYKLEVDVTYGDGSTASIPATVIVEAANEGIGTNGAGIAVAPKQIKVAIGKTAKFAAPTNKDGKPLGEGTKFALAEDAPKWASIDAKTGVVTVAPPETVKSGEYEIPIQLTYPNGTSETVKTSVIVTEADGSVKPADGSDAAGDVKGSDVQEKQVKQVKNIKNPNLPKNLAKTGSSAWTIGTIAAASVAAGASAVLVAGRKRKLNND